MKKALIIGSSTQISPFHKTILSRLGIEICGLYLKKWIDLFELISLLKKGGYEIVILKRRVPQYIINELIRRGFKVLKLEKKTIREVELSERKKRELASYSVIDIRV